MDFCFLLFFLSNPTFLRRWCWKMLAAVASLAFLKDALAFLQIKLFWKAYFSDRYRNWALGNNNYWKISQEMIFLIW